VANRCRGDELPSELPESRRTDGGVLR